MWKRRRESWVGGKVSLERALEVAKRLEEREEEGEGEEKQMSAFEEEMKRIMERAMIERMPKHMMEKSDSEIEKLKEIR
jgi:hypothetical protein